MAAPASSQAMSRARPARERPTVVGSPALAIAALLLGLLAIIGSPGDLQAQNSNDRKARALSPAERSALNQLESMSPEALKAMAAATGSAALEARVREVLAAGPLFIGERQHDSEGLAPIHHHLFAKLRAQEDRGLRILGTLRGEVPVPVEVHNLREQPADAPSAVEVGGEQFRVTPLWPNGAMPSLAPAGGIRGRLADVGRGEWQDLNGKDLAGAVVLMDFAGARNWERALSLGARAVIVLEDDRVVRDNAERLFMNTPVPMPRFYARKEVAARLRAIAKQGGDSEAVLRGGAVFEARPFTSIFAYLPPPAELPVYVVKPDDLLARIAAENNVSIDDLRAANGALAGPPAAGTVLKLPGGTKTYSVGPNDLLKRVAAFNGLTEEQLAAANPNLSGEPAPGQALKIPHLDGPLLIAVPIDSVSVTPHEPHGLKSAANIAASLTLMEHLAREAGGARRRGVVFAFLDAEHLGGRSSRLLAEFQLLSQGKFAQRYAGQETLEKRMARYAGGAAWFREGTVPERDVAEWLAAKWLKTRLEAARIGLAEGRIAHLLKVQNARTPEADREGARAALARSEKALEALVTLRDTTLLNRGLDPAARIAALREALADGAYGGELAPDLKAAGLDFAAFALRMEAEWMEEVTAGRADDSNRALIQALEALRATPEGGANRPLFGWYLHLSPGSLSLGVDEASAGDFRAGERPGEGVSKKVSERFRKVGAHAALRAGWPEEWTFLQSGDRADTLVLEEKGAPYYPEFWIPSGFALEPLRTRNDLQEQTDTPHDLPDYANFENLSLQLRTATLMVRLILESAVDWPSVQVLQTPGFGRLVGKTVEFNIRSGIDAKEPVPGVLVVHPDTKREINDTSYNTATYRGCSPRGVRPEPAQRRVPVPGRERFAQRLPVLRPERLRLRSRPRARAVRPTGGHGSGRDQKAEARLQAGRRVGFREGAGHDPRVSPPVFSRAPTRSATSRSAAKRGGSRCPSSMRCSTASRSTTPTSPPASIMPRGMC
jgi:LysM repeat protein